MVAITGDLPGLPQIPGLLEPAPREVFADPVPVGRTDLQARTRVGPAAYVYEVSGRPATYYVDVAFGERLDAWLGLHRLHTGETPDAVRSYSASVWRACWRAVVEAWVLRAARSARSSARNTSVGSA